MYRHLYYLRQLLGMTSNDAHRTALEIAITMMENHIMDENAYNFGDITGNNNAVGDSARSINTDGGDYAEGNIDKRKGTFVQGENVEIVVSAADSIDIDTQLRHARDLILHKQYSQANHIYQDVLRQEPQHPTAHLIGAIAALGGRFADDHQSETTIQSIEASLLIAAKEPSLAATAWAMLGIIAVDFYQQKHLPSRTHSLKTDRQALLSAGGMAAVDPDLWQLVRATPTALQKIAQTS